MDGDDLYTFTGVPDGRNPHLGLDSAGNGCGITREGGVNGVSTVYELTHSSSGGGSVNVLHGFSRPGRDYFGQVRCLTRSAICTGITIWGGGNGVGGVFRQWHGLTWANAEFRRY
jgi:hypothetical protein